MAGISRLGDISTGHGGYHPTPVIGASSNVITNGIGTARVGDQLAVHVKPKSPPHVPVISSGSGTVIVNGKSVARAGDPCGCGDSLSGSSGNVIAGG